MSYKREITSEKLSKKRGTFQVAKRDKTLKPLEKFHTCNISETEKNT